MGGQSPGFATNMLSGLGEFLDSSCFRPFVIVLGFCSFLIDGIDSEQTRNSHRHLEKDFE